MKLHRLGTFAAITAAIMAPFNATTKRGFRRSQRGPKKTHHSARIKSPMHGICGAESNRYTRHMGGDAHDPARRHNEQRRGDLGHRVIRIPKYGRSLTDEQFANASIIYKKHGLNFAVIKNRIGITGVMTGDELHDEISKLSI